MLIFALFSFCVSLRLFDTTVRNSLNIGITWEGGACSSQSGFTKPCPTFNFEAYVNGNPSNKYITLSYAGMEEVDTNGDLVDMTCDLSAFGLGADHTVPKAVQQIPDDYTAIETLVPGGSEVFMNASLAWVQTAIDQIIIDNDKEADRVGIEDAVSNAFGSAMWRETYFEINHVLADTAPIDVQYGDNITVTVSPDNFKFSFLIYKWPFASSNTNRLKIRLRFTGRNLVGGCKWYSRLWCRDSPYITEDPSYNDGQFGYHRVTFVSNYYSYNMDFIKEANMITGGVGTMGNVEIVAEDYISSGYVDVVLTMPLCSQHDDCTIEYDPTMGLASAGVAVVMNLFVVLMIVFLLM